MGAENVSGVDLMITFLNLADMLCCKLFSSTQVEDELAQ